MGFLSFLSPKDALPPALRAPQPQLAPSQPLAGPRPTVGLRREEILDHKNRLCGYRFGMLADRGVHPETEFFEALVDAHIPEFAASRLAAIPLTPDAVLFNRHVPLAAPHTLFVLDGLQ